MVSDPASQAPPAASAASVAVDRPKAIAAAITGVLVALAIWGGRLEVYRVRARRRSSTAALAQRRAARLSQFPGSAQLGESKRLETASMPEHTAANQTPVAKELERRLRRRARRASILRRRVGALTISLFLVSWGAIYGGSYLGVAGAKALRVTTTAPAARARRPTPVRRAGHPVERGVRVERVEWFVRVE